MDSLNEHRFPNFAKLVVAILESKVETVLGENAVKEIKSPLQSKELRLQLFSAVKRAEERFVEAFPEREIADALKELPLFNLPTIQKAIIDFYNNPSSSGTKKQLETQFKLILSTRFSSDQLSIAASEYVVYLWEEMTSVEELRERLAALATIRTEQRIAAMQGNLSVIQDKLSQLTTDAQSVGGGVYSKPALSNAPALIVFLIDIGFKMSRDIDGMPASEYIRLNLANGLQRLARLSTKGSRIIPRYHLACFTYAAKVSDVFSGIQPLGKILEADIPKFEVSGEPADTYEGFLYVDNLISRNLKKYTNSPAPLVCHITSGEYPGRNPQFLTDKIQRYAVPDGNVLIENVLIDDEAVLVPTTKVKYWPGIRDESELAKAYAARLFNMSSVIPESYRIAGLELGYSLAPNSRMLFPGNHPDIISLGFAMSAVTRMA